MDRIREWAKAHRGEYETMPGLERALADVEQETEAGDILGYLAESVYIRAFQDGAQWANRPREHRYYDPETASDFEPIREGRVADLEEALLTGEPTEGIVQGIEEEYMSLSSTLRGCASYRMYVRTEREGWRVPLTFSQWAMATGRRKEAEVAVYGLIEWGRDQEKHLASGLLMDGRRKAVGELYGAYRECCEENGVKPTDKWGAMCGYGLEAVRYAWGIPEES